MDAETIRSAAIGACEIPDVAPPTGSADRRLSHDTSLVLRLRDWIRDRCGVGDRRRLLAITACGHGSSPFLRPVLPDLLAKARDAGLGIDVILGLNDNAPAPGVLDDLVREGISVTELWAAPKQHIAEAALVYGNEQLSGNEVPLTGAAGAGARIFVMHQQRSPYSPGQIRMLLDIYGWCVRSIARGWTPPAWAMRFDAESHLLVDRSPNADSADPDSNGLPLLLAPLMEDENLGLAGARVRFCAFSHSAFDTAVPDWGHPISPFLWMSHRLQGRSVEGSPVLDWIGGPAFAGRTATLLALGYVGCHNCPGSRAEDFLLTHLCNHAGLQHRVAVDCIATNRVPPSEDTEATRQQLRRFIAASLDVLDYYGQRPKLPLRDLFQVVREMLKRPQTFWQGPRILFGIRGLRGDVRNGNATWEDSVRTLGVNPERS